MLGVSWAFGLFSAWAGRGKSGVDLVSGSAEWARLSYSPQKSATAIRAAGNGDKGTHADPIDTICKFAPKL